MEFVEFFMVGPTASSLRFRNIKMILFRCFSSRPPQSTLVTWFWFRSPPSSAASVSLSSLSGLSRLFYALTLHPRIFPWFFPSLSGLISLVSPFSSIQTAHQTCRRSRRLEKVRPGRRPRKGEEEKDKRPRVWSNHDELDREMGTELTQPLAVPTWS